MAKTPVERIAAMLSDDAPEKRIAAAIVLGELGSKEPAVIAGLVGMLDTESPPLQRPALAALARIGTAKAAAATFPLLASKDSEVRALAVDALVAGGDDVVQRVRQRIPLAAPDERRALDAVLARFGDSKDAVTTLLRGLEATEPEVVRAVALEVRPQIKNADAKTRKLWLAELGRIIDAMRKRPPATPAPLAAAVKILGYLEEPKSVPTLLTLARDAKAPFAVRQEALIALRFALGDDAHAGNVIDALVAAAAEPDRMLGQAALMGLVAVDLPAKHAARIAKLAVHDDPERARIAIEKLARMPGLDVTKALVNVLADRRRGELAAKALAGRDGAGPLIAAALCAEHDVARASTLRAALRPHVKSLGTAHRKKLVESALARLADGAGWQPHVEAAREADGAGLTTGLRELSARLARGKDAQAQRDVLSLLVKSEHATAEDRYRLASALLRESRLDTRAASRQADDALSLLANLVARGFDVAGALRKDKSLSLEHLYYVGFHSIEIGDPLGQELLAQVVEKAGRTKLGKMAKNKLKLSDAEG